MTPEEKAKELVNRYFLEIEGADTYAFNLPSMNLFISKKCALLAVDEVLDSISSIYDYDREVLEPYWLQVKQEIEVL